MLQSIQNDFYKKVIQLEDEILKNALNEHLGRESTISDFADCEKHILIGHPENYKFLYKGTLLGEMKISFNCINNTINVTCSYYYYKIKKRHQSHYVLTPL